MNSPMARMPGDVRAFAPLETEPLASLRQAPRLDQPVPMRPTRLPALALCLIVASPLAAAAELWVGYQNDAGTLCVVLSTDASYPLVSEECPEGNAAESSALALEETNLVVGVRLSDGTKFCAGINDQGMPFVNPGCGAEQLCALTREDGFCDVDSGIQLLS